MKPFRNRVRLLVLIFSLIVFLGSGSSAVLNADVTGVTVSVTPSNYTGNCPKVLTFTGRINVVMRGELDLRYRWIRSDGATLPIQGARIVRTGVVVKTVTWTLGAAGKSYRDYWMALEILPSSYSPGTDYRSVTPLMTSNRALFTLNCVNTPASIAAPRVLPNRNVLLPLALPQYEISGRISTDPSLGCLSCLHGRKIKIILRNGRTVTNHIFSLDRNSSYNYRFKSPFITAGTYTITIEQGPPDQANYGNDLNPCFNGAAPLTRTVTLTSTNKKALNQDFLIAFTLRWGGGGLCW